MKYPNIIFFRFKKYIEIDDRISNNDKYDCSFLITDNSDDLNKLFDTNHHLLVTYGDTEKEYYPYILPFIANRFRDRWFHKFTGSLDNIDQFNYNANYCYIHNVISKRENTRPSFSIFTTCYNSYDKIYRAYNGLISQKHIDWEWVIIDDSPDDKHFDFLRDVSRKDKRIRLYKRDFNSGNIGNVKNESIALCRGKYILELDHDDIVLPDVLHDAYTEFEEDESVGFIYMDFANVYENWDNFSYGDFISKGYGGYLKEKYNNHWVNTYITPNVNNITLSALYCLPNHPRIWRKSVLMQIESYSEFLPICDDLEILLRTALNTKITKIQKLGYIQFMNNGNNNFSLIRNSEINRIGPQYIYPQFFKKFNVHEKMKEIDGYEDESYIKYASPIYKRSNYTHKYINKKINKDYDKHYCLMGLNCLDKDNIKELYDNPRNDFILLSNEDTCEEIIKKLEDKQFCRMKCYSLKITNEELENYFHLFCKHNQNYEIIYGNDNHDEISKIYDLNLKSLHEKFIKNEPFNHIVIDNSINKDLLKKAKNEILKIPIENFAKANVIGNDLISVNKYYLQDLSNNIKEIRDYFNSETFLKWLEELTNIKNLKSDNTNHGGGIHLIKRGGYLNVHQDFTKHSKYNLYRVLNILIYFNDNYQDNYNGKLELWNTDMTKCEKSIEPIFNRMIIFRTDTNSNHGHPIPWESDEDRLSLALYYYVDYPINKEANETTSATWKNPILNCNNYFSRHTILNNYINKYNKLSYLEIGVENGYTFSKINIENKLGVDPDPKIEDKKIIKMTSDKFFETNKKTFDIIFIDGMHQVEYVLKDFNNSIKFLNENGFIFIDDVIPKNEEEQYKIPINPIYENNILKYSSPWTGDVWKFIYYLLIYHKTNIDYEIFIHPNYRGVIKIVTISSFEVKEEAINVINNYDYTTDFEKYKKILFKL